MDAILNAVVTIDGAIEQYQKVISLTPDNQEGYTNLGAAYFDNDQWDEAADCVEKGS